MLRLLLLLTVFLILAGVFVEARFLEVIRVRPLLDGSDEASFLPQRQLRQVVDYQPLPCRWKLCASYY